MAKENDRNYVSLGFWMLALFVSAIPCVGLIMVLVWAFAGENESRKNFFRALILWFLITTAFWAAFFALGFGSALLLHLQSLASPQSTQ